MHQKKFTHLLTLALCAMSTTALAAVNKSAFDSRFPTASPLAKIIGADADAALDSAATGAADNQAWKMAEEKAKTTFSLAIAYGTTRDLDAFREADFARRLLQQLQPLEPDARQDLLKYLRAHDELARSMAFTIRPGDNIAAAYKLLDQLRHQRPKQVEALSNLTVALCVVRDRPLSQHINENTAEAADPLAVFDFYASHENQMLYGLKDMPVELLIYVVDTTASIQEMTWAAQKYAGTTEIGKLFFTIKYDYAYLEGKAPKKLDVAGFGLKNILKVGGVCIDQAYFATTVGKAIGVPTAIATAASAEAGHAWVGYLQVRGHSAEWNFDSGRYEEYKGVRGNVPDPQIGQSVADSSVSMVGDVIGTTVVQRQTAVAMVDAARTLLGLKNISKPGKAKIRKLKENGNSTDDEAEFTPPAIPDSLPPAVKAAMHKPRSATADSALDLVEMGLRQYASYPPGWELVSELAAKDELSEAQKKTWADLVQRLCGQRHPDFALAVLEPMIVTVKDPAVQSGLWDAVFATLQKRPDLAAEVRLHQATMWHERGDLVRAGQCYEDVIQRYINAGPFALRALEGAEKVLKQSNQPAKVLDLYAHAFAMVTKPDLDMSSDFIKQSNWYKVREAYANKLEEAGQTKQAEAIRADVGHTAASGG